MKLIKWHLCFYAGLILAVAMLNACKSLKNLSSTPAPWTGSRPAGEPIMNDCSKPNVFIVADNKMTEMFDMLAPFYLFNASQKANVYIVAVNNNPILIKRDLFVKPQLTFAQAEAMHMKAAVIVIPALSVRSDVQDTAVVNWIIRNNGNDTRLLSICDGASTAAATGLYDGKPITCHASDYAGVKKYFDKPVWMQNVSVANSGRLYSTAGVSNAVEGSLLVIGDLFGSDVAQRLMSDINYPYQKIRTEHRSVAVRGRDKFTAFRKIFFRRNKNLAFLLENDVNEFRFASILDTYGRTFPSTMSIVIPNDTVVQTKYGLKLIYTGDTANHNIDELHVLHPATFSKGQTKISRRTKIVTYDALENEYPIDACLQRISQQYGRSFTQLVKISLDYN